MPRRIWAAIVIAVLLFSVIDWGSTLFWPEDIGQYRPYSEQNKKGIAPLDSFILSGLIPIRDWLGDFIDKNHDAINAAATVFVALFTFTLWRSTVRLWRTSQTHADHTERSIVVAEKSGRITREFYERQAQLGSMQLRAYVSVLVNGLVPQNRTTNYKYEVRMIARNTGRTPAHAIRIASRLQIFPFPLPDEIDLSLSTSIAEAAAHLNPGQECFFRARLAEMISDAEVSEIRGVSAKKIYVFGTIYYQDAFGEERRTNFCQYGMWDINGRFAGVLNTARHNDAT